MDPVSNTFGAFFKQARLDAGFSLRAFCIKHNLDPGNISKLERGRLLPAKTNKKLEQWAECLGLEKSSERHQEFFDLAYACNGRVPPELLNDEEVVKKLPLIFKALRNKTDAEDRLDRLVEAIRRA